MQWSISTRRLLRLVWDQSLWYCEIPRSVCADFPLETNYSLPVSMLNQIHCQNQPISSTYSCFVLSLPSLRSASTAVGELPLCICQFCQPLRIHLWLCLCRILSLSESVLYLLPPSSSASLCMPNLTSRCLCVSPWDNGINQIGPVLPVKCRRHEGKLPPVQTLPHDGFKSAYVGILNKLTFYLQAMRSDLCSKCISQEIYSH